MTDWILSKPGPYTVGSSGKTDADGIMHWTASEDALTISDDELQKILSARA